MLHYAFYEIGNVLNIDLQTFTFHPLIPTIFSIIPEESIIYTETENSGEEPIVVISIMEDMKHPVNELRNAIKIEAMEWSQESEAMEIFTGRTFTFFVENDVQSSKKGMHSRSKMDDVEHDFTNALRNVMKMEKIDSSIYSETQEISSTGHTFEEEESQKIMVNQNPEMTFNQDKYRHATNSCCKDGYSENLKDEHFSYCNKKYQLVYVEKKSYLLKIGTETFSSSKIKNEMIYLGASLAE
ncbi:zinc finger protein 287 [Biomphalaria pfeifferi]|uniref:Zinc finger protein 287 n=1 Tax=Biomphalaria pfeifferi TaxID=112525 RepID=A0AAD8FCQ3_BIOPF|nr:zinc finger protein 287 [Biomphalaria pfeifferi]